MRKVIEAVVDEKKEPINYAPICKKYGFSVPKSGKKMSINNGIINITFTEKPFSYFISMLGGYQKSVDRVSKMRDSFEKAENLLNDIKNLISMEVR